MKHWIAKAVVTLEASLGFVPHELN